MGPFPTGEGPVLASFIYQRPSVSRMPACPSGVATLISQIRDTPADLEVSTLRISIAREVVQGDFVRDIEQLSGQNILQCYQCGECSAGCPISAEMDVLPNHIIRLIQLGQADEVMAAQSSLVRPLAKFMPRLVKMAPEVELPAVAAKEGEQT